MVVDADIVALEHPRQFLLWIGPPIDVDRWIVGAHNAVPDRRELIVAVEKKRFHPPYPDPLPAPGGRGRSPLTVDAPTSNTSHARTGPQGLAREDLGERATCVLPAMLCTAGRASAWSPARGSSTCAPACIASRA